MLEYLLHHGYQVICLSSNVSSFTTVIKSFAPLSGLLHHRKKTSFTMVITSFASLRRMFPPPDVRIFSCRDSIYYRCGINATLVFFICLSSNVSSFTTVIKSFASLSGLLHHREKTSFTMVITSFVARSEYAAAKLEPLRQILVPPSLQELVIASVHNGKEGAHALH